MAEIQFDDQVDITDKVCPLTFVKAKSSKLKSWMMVKSLQFE